MNLRELIALLECQGMPETSEFEVVTDYGPSSILGIQIDSQSETVWLMTEEY